MEADHKGIGIINLGECPLGDADMFACQTHDNFSCMVGKSVGLAPNLL
jgi:hypothetical protein